jgi:3,4-dihydroxy 2-butanone 4-phosphate synthase/GTP cyclohydrolase II
VFGSLRCDCKQQLDASFDLIEHEGRGAIIYLQQEGRGIGLANKVAAYGLQDAPRLLDTVEANHELGFAEELRSYECAPALLRDLGVASVRLLTNNPYKVASLEALGVRVAERLPLLAGSPLTPLSDASRAYLRTKALRMAHLIPAEVYAPPSLRSSQALEVLQSERLPPPPPRAPPPAANRGAVAMPPYAAAAAARRQVFVNPATGREHRWTTLGRGSVEAAVAANGRGEAVVVTDDEARENEGDLILAARFATTESIAFVVRHTGGVVCCALPGPRLDALGIPPMVVVNEDAKGTAFGVTVDATAGTTTGISASDRAATLRALADPASTPGSFRRPGHVFPLRARAGGVLARGGHTEAAVDLCRLAGVGLEGALSEVVTADSAGMARMPELAAFCEAHNLVLTTIEDLVCYRLSEGV